MGKYSNDLYRLSRSLGKASSIIRDIETLATGDPKKICKRAEKKAVGKMMYKINRSIMKKI